MTSKLFILPVAVSLLGACTSQERAEPMDLADDTAIRLVGEPQDCVTITSIRSSDIVDEYTIDFKVGTDTYRNRLPNRCIGLKSADSFTYETSQSRLCNVDIIYTLENYGASYQRGAGCGLGQFQKIEKVPQ